MLFSVNYYYLIILILFVNHLSYDKLIIHWSSFSQLQSENILSYKPLSRISSGFFVSFSCTINILYEMSSWKRSQENKKSRFLQYLACTTNLYNLSFGGITYSIKKKRYFTFEKYEHSMRKCCPSTNHRMLCCFKDNIFKTTSSASLF